MIPNTFAALTKTRLDFMIQSEQDSSFCMLQTIVEKSKATYQKEEQSVCTL